MFAALLTVLAAVPLVQEERPTAEELVADAWQFLPTYDGEHRAVLEDDVRQATRAGAHLLEAALALEPDHLRGLWSLGHAQVLLAEDLRTRGEDEAARTAFLRAHAALSRAIELDPTDPWALYARGAASTSFGEHASAIVDLTRAFESAEKRIADGEGGSTPWLRYKALEWLPEAKMRLGDHSGAREDLKAFHDEFSTNRWPLAITMAESFQREHDFVGARDSYESVLEEFGSDHQAFALLGYLAGLQGDRELATSRLKESLDREVAPGLWGRLWLWLLATDEARPAAEEDLRGLLEFPPSSMAPWEVTLGRFVLGGSSVEEFLAAAGDEERRRIAVAEPLDDLLCEVWFYVGLRREAEASAAEGGTALELLRAAHEAYAAALRLKPQKWKWEWAFARNGFADTAAALGVSADSPVVREGSRVRVGDVEGELVQGSWHVPRAARPMSSLDREPRVGDLFLGLVRSAGALRPVWAVVGLE